MLIKLKIPTIIVFVVTLQAKISGNEGNDVIDKNLSLFTSPKKSLSLQDSTIIENGIEFVLIPAGSFTMGTPDNEPERNSDESPVHKVTISHSFYIGKYELTQAQFVAMMGYNPSKFKGKNRPVDSVTWPEAVKFCKKLSEMTGQKYRLPTEAEWEYACRANTSTTFYWGNDIDDAYAWYKENSEGTTHPVGMKKPNPWGLYDICGNIEEWCCDWYSRTYESNGHVKDPQGPDSGELRVRRGGCWYHTAPCLRSGNRFYYQPDERHAQIGFRVVRQ
jgi:formylglycine-generating enzyme required for sulfatase activity